jgi:peptidoglycan/LPS O-acetylase OafA/YrhL
MYSRATILNRQGRSVATNTISKQAVTPRADQGLSIEPPEIRYEQLDGLRGLAAFVVFLFHALMIVPPESPVLRVLTIPVLRPLWDGPGAVMLFFVLSGFVLALPYTGKIPRKIEPGPFLIRRVARLYPAYWAVIILALALRFIVFNVHGLAGLSSWTAMHWSLPVGWMSIARHLFMISPGLQVDEIDPVIWSLIIEMKISIVFPLLVLIVSRTRRLSHALIALALSVALTTPLHFVTHSSSSWSRAAIMAPMFLLGSYLAKYRSEAVSVLRKSRTLRVVMAVAGAIAYSFVWITPLHSQGFARFGNACGSGIFILLFLASPRLEKLGTGRLTRFLGKVSYSFYLVHLPILIALASLLYPRVHSLFAVIAISLMCSLLAAWVIYALVEIPAHNWGKRLAFSVSTKLSRTRTAAVTG